MQAQRIYAFIFILGSGFLLYRTIAMVAEEALEILTSWAFILLIAEMLVDLGCLLSSVRWFTTNDRQNARLPVRLAVVMVFLHAVRVLVFVLGRIGPWVDFDVRPEHRASHGERWSWDGVYFAAVMAGLSVIVLILIWVYARLKRTKP